MENDKNLNGCIVLVKGKTFMAKQIILHMKLLAIRNKKKPLPWSHAEFLLWKAGELYTIGAREKGTEISKASEYYKGKEYIILHPLIKLTATETALLWKYFYSVDESKYQYGTFAAWITLLKLGIWFGKKGDLKVYCYELAARFANEVNRWTGPSLDMVSIYDLTENKHYI